MTRGEVEINESGEQGRPAGARACSESRARAAEAVAQAWQSAPLGCTGSPEEVTEIVRLLDSLASDSSAPPERTRAGYALLLPPSPQLERRAHEFIGRDSACCPFLEFELGSVGPDLRLEVSGPEGARMVLDLSFELCRVAAEQRPRS